MRSVWWIPVDLGIVGESVFSAFRPVWLIPVRSGLGRGLLTARARSGGWTPACVPRWVDPRELAVGFSASLSLPEALGRSPRVRGRFERRAAGLGDDGSIPASHSPFLPVSTRFSCRSLFSQAFPGRCLGVSGSAEACRPPPLDQDVRPVVIMLSCDPFGCRSRPEHNEET